MKLRSRVTTLDVTLRASALAPQMDSEGRDVRAAVGSDQLLEPDSVIKIMHVLHD